VTGAEVRDIRSGRRLRIGARAVVSCAGPQVRSLARDRGGDPSALFRVSLAFNVLLDASFEAEGAVAVAASRPAAPILFLIPQPGSVLAGTMHVPRPAETSEAAPSEAELETFLAWIRDAVPGLDVKLHSVRRVFAGLLPVRAEQSVALSTRDVVLDHGRAGGSRGFYSVSGVKFTTARSVAARVLDVVLRGAEVRGRAIPGGASSAPWAVSAATPLLTDARRLWSDPEDVLRKALLDTVQQESVHSLDDLVLRRTNWSTTETDLDAVRRRIAELLPASQPDLRGTGT
jgi:glycerol-3-phosphate dehydrogenase